MKITLSSVLVSDQDKALTFYTTVLGFVKKQDTPMGDYRWLTVVSPGDPDNVELVLEPLAFKPATTYQKALFGAAIPAIAFEVADLRREYQRLMGLGVVFKNAPTVAGQVASAVLDDTCGNLIQLYQPTIQSPHDTLLTYHQLLARIKRYFLAAQRKAEHAITREMTDAFLFLGSQIARYENEAGWGSQEVENLSCDLQDTLGDNMTFTKENLQKMRQLYESWQASPEIRDLVADVPWNYNLVLIDHVPDLAKRAWYLQQVRTHGWSLDFLIEQITKRA